MRDEGTSYHYLPPSEFAEADLTLAAAALEQLKGGGQRIYRGAAWTTERLFARPSRRSAKRAPATFSPSRWRRPRFTPLLRRGERRVLCFAHVTNRMAVESGDFEKGEADGSAAALAVIAAAARGWRRASPAEGPG